MSISFNTSQFTAMPRVRGNSYSGSNTHENKTNKFTQIVDNKNEKEDIQSESQEEPCDVKNATFIEINKVAQTLLDSGEINLGEFAKMVFNPSASIACMQTCDLRFNNKFTLQLKNNPMFEGYDNQKHNWIEIFERKANQQFSLGNRDGGNSYIKIKNALESLSKDK